MQSKQLATTPVASSRRVQDCLTTGAARAAYLEIEHALQYGREWLWNGCGPVLTAAGVARVAEQVAELGAEEDAARLRALAATLVPAPQRPTEPAAATVRAMRPERSHLPYADADDAQIFANHEHHAEPRHH